jgi:hypothetical protein
MQRNWTTVGQKLAGMELEDGVQVIDQAAVVRAIGTVEWQEIPEGGTISVAMMPGEGIKEAIKQLRIPKVSHIAISNELAPFGFYGIRGHYKNGDAEVFLVDTGCSITPVCSDFYPKGE